MRIYQPNAHGYSVKYFDREPDTAPPKFGFAVVDAGGDRGEVFLSSNSIRLSIKHPTVVAYFSTYFDRVWAKAKELKIGKIIYEETIREIANSFEDT